MGSGIFPFPCVHAVVTPSIDGIWTPTLFEAEILVAIFFNMAVRADFDSHERRSMNVSGNCMKVKDLWSSFH